MFFQTKKKKIAQYIETEKDHLSVFGELLKDYLTGDFKAFFVDFGITSIEIHIDWLDDYKCIGLQGKFKNNYVDLQIEPTEFGFAIDPDEPDIDGTIPLTSKEAFYSIIKEKLLQN